MKRTSRIAITSVCLTVASLLPAAHAQEYAFQYFGVEQGLTNLSIKTLFQDRTGFIWVGTEVGVFRYEGVRFREFSRKEGLPSSIRVSFGEAPDGSVLVGNREGLYRFRTERFEPVPLPGNRHITGYNSIARDNSRTWIATDGGLLAATLRPDGRLSIEPGPQAPNSSLTEAHGLLVDGQTLWWGCGNSLCRSENGRVTVMGEQSGLLPQFVDAIIRDRQGNLWVEQLRKLLVLRPGASRFSQPETPWSTTGTGSPCLDQDGRLLVPTTEGLAIGDGTHFELAARNSGLLPPVYSVLQDREGSVWLGLAGRGLAKWLGYSEWESFSAQSGLTGELVYEVMPAANGVVWAGTEAGFFRGERIRNHWQWRIEPAVGTIPVHAVQADPDGHLWLGTDTRGIARFDPKTEGVRWFGGAEGLTVKKGGSAKNVWAVLVDRRRAVWAGTSDGLFVMEPGTDRFHPVQEVSIRCFAITEAANGDILVGTRAGVARRSAGKWREITPADGLRSDNVIAVAADKSGNVWIGYRFNGILTRMREDNGKLSFRHFDPPAGRGINITYFLGFDDQGQLWAGSNLGIRTLRPDGHWKQFDHNDGLIWNDCDLHGFAAEADGHIWIGTSGGLSRFLPRAAPHALGPPRTVFTSVLSGKTEFDPSRRFSIDYSAEPLVVRFTALRFGRDRDLTFRYKLDPLFRNWKETTENELQFPALPPGTYRIDVEARDSASGWSDIPASFDFRVKAPWWREWWFLGGCGLAGALSAGFFLKRKTAREESIRRALENAVAERTRELSHQYRHDVLTGLPNRLLFGEHLQRELLTAQRDGSMVAVLFIDLDRFKRINDMWGHQTGDLFLKQIAERLRSGLRAGEMIARIGGDEFIALIPGLRAKQEAEARGCSLLRTLEAPVHIEGKNVFATMSVGISTFPEDGLEAGALMAAADAAMYRAKGSGKNQVQLFEPEMTEAASRPQNIEDRLREALTTGRFRLFYQPQYGLDGQLLGFEALLRIHGLERELGPSEFIPIAEESGLIVEMGAWVLDEACRQMSRWHRDGFGDVRVAVNVSVVQLAHAGFEKYLLEVIEKTGIDPAHLELELTETALVKDTGNSAGLLNRIREHGIQVALDDFGTGFSPMRYLHQLPVDVVKIDRVFIRDLDGSPSSLPLVEGMVKLARNLSLKVVAEGVETRGQLEILRQIGFDAAQGNLLSPPVGAERAEELLRESREEPRSAPAAAR